MEHYEFMFLMHQAHLLKKLFERAEAENEEFHVSDSFMPLKCGIKAQAMIRKINPDDEQPVLILRLRYDEDVLKGMEVATKTANIFFNNKFTKLPTLIKENGWCECVYFSPDVPQPITVGHDAATNPESDAPATPPSTSRG